MPYCPKPVRTRIRFAIAVAALVLAPAALAQPADSTAVDVVNASEPTLCAEKDNVYLKLLSSAVRRFKVEAEHPAYMGTIVVDRWAHDLRNCEFASDPAFKAEPRRVTIYETEEWQLVGLTFPAFWRPANVPVRVGDRVEKGLHLLQLWTRFQDRAEEVLVLYPADGYWRARPLPPPHLRWSAYGSSFLVGPIEVEGRPFVDIREIVFEPTSRTFRLDFARGGQGVLRLDKLDQERIVLDVALNPAAGGGGAGDAQRPFAALRSMYVKEGNADVAHVAWRAQGAQQWTQAPVMAFKQARAVELWSGRLTPSRHNTSAPDVIFRDFSAGSR
jgi:hypothetical protein